MSISETATSPAPVAPVVPQPGTIDSKLPIVLSPVTLLLIAIGCGLAVALVTWFLAQPFLPPIPKARDVIYPAEVAVATFLIPGVIHSLIASSLFLMIATLLAWQSGTALLRRIPANDQDLAQLARQRGAIRLGLGDRALGQPVLLIGLVILVIAYAALLSYLQFRSVDDFFASVFRASVGWRWAAFLVFGLLAPIAEEMLFRGWLWTGLRQSWPSFTCTLITGLLWVGTHASEGVAKMAILMPIALLLGFARGQSASLRAPVLLHLALNLASLTIPFLLQGLLGD